MTAGPEQGGSRGLRRTFVAGCAVASIVLSSCGSRGPNPAPSPVATGVPSGAPAGPASGEPGPPPCAAPVPAAVPGPWWENRVFYEAFVRSFADADGDGFGDLAGMTARLDYLNDGDPSTTDDLGVTGIWLMPVFASGSYHGYDVTDYGAIEPDYGTIEDFRAFLAAAHTRGIKVILDLVLNHTSIDHPWFQDALAGGPHRDWYLWRDADPRWLPVAGGSPWHESASGWYYGAFGARMPDLNLNNPLVTAELVRTAEAWLDEGVDGFRLDAVKHLIEKGSETQVNTTETRVWLRDFRAALHAAHPDAFVLGEVWESRAITTNYVSEGSLDQVFDFGIGPAILGAATLGDATSLEVGLSEVSDRYPPGGAATFLTNHDQPRAMTVLRGDVAAAAQSAAALLTGPGTPFIYYGEELGMRGTKPDEDIRTPLPWTSSGPGFGFTTGTPWEPFGPGAESGNVTLEAAVPGSLLSTYRDLIRLRGTHPELAGGTVTRLETARADLAATLRVIGGRAALVVQNLGDRPAVEAALTLDSGPLCGEPGATLAYASDAAIEHSPAQPSITATGGLDAYRPLPLLPARSTVVIDLSP